MSNAALTTDLVLSFKFSTQSNSESVLTSDVVSKGTVINVSYPVHQTFLILSNVSDTLVRSIIASTAPSSTKEEKLTTVTPVEMSIPQTPSLQTPQIVSDNILTVSDVNIFSAATAHESSNSLTRKTSMSVTNSKMISNVGSSDSKTVTNSTAFPTNGGKVTQEMMTQLLEELLFLHRSKHKQHRQRLTLVKVTILNQASLKPHLMLLLCLQ